MKNPYKYLLSAILLVATVFACSADVEVSVQSDTTYNLPAYNRYKLPMIFRGHLISPKLTLPNFSIVARDLTLCRHDSVEYDDSTTFMLPRNNQLLTSIELDRMIESNRYHYMLQHPEDVQFASWQLPMPKGAVPDENIPVGLSLSPLPLGNPVIENVAEEIKHVNWLHDFNGLLQFSQAYLTRNWYQGGNDYLALLFNINWAVNLNQAYHPNLLFSNIISYKLGLNSTPQDKFHKYSLSEDLFQWNLKAGLKAHEKWFYSVTLQFKTQIFNNYPQDSETKSASFLSPGDLNLGLGMTFSTTNKSGSLKFNMSLAPLSYNLKTCIDPAINPTQFDIALGKHTKSEIGSSGEFVLDWNLRSNINYKTRLFLFSNYQNFLGDWEHTLSFSITKFLSTQIYVHLRYDTSTDPWLPGWRRLQLKEILSFGFNYTFSSKVS